MSKKTTTSDFFKEAKEKSKIKIFIVTEFFKTYFSIINNRKFSEKVFYYKKNLSNERFFL